MPQSSWLIVRGIVGLVIGLLALAWPGVTVAVLIAIFAVYAFVDGVTNVVLGIRRSRELGRSWPLIIQGIVGIAAGVLAFVWPTLTVFALIMFIGAWAVVTGAFEIAAAIRLRKVISGEWLMFLSGLLSIVFGVLVFAFPAAGAIGVAWVLGAYAAIAGAVLIALGISVRSRAMGLPRVAHP